MSYNTEENFVNNVANDNQDESDSEDNKEDDYLNEILDKEDLIKLDLGELITPIFRELKDYDDMFEKVINVIIRANQLKVKIKDIILPDIDPEQFDENYE
ncbi:MAG TPA: hypothetical protein PLI27_09305 [Ignavibacteriales bacterium]|nr:hypothetical protein [Ignavibacteriales bacterium]HOL80197.1 hypothetical protein [Ignavibacteriales bacterium]HOM64479.1 hypothetical protein [Ignavibacteriales bacterium]HPD68256.1 hypothetical protein [Ignavibacteriales bacterium]HPP32386.1 hypothetical protein [Ignavibacteriales bacterium]